MSAVAPQLKAIIDGVIAREGGYVNDPRDAGGETNWGITKAVARANGWAGPMRQLSLRHGESLHAAWVSFLHCCAACDSSFILACPRAIIVRKI